MCFQCDCGSGVGLDILFLTNCPTCSHLRCNTCEIDWPKISADRAPNGLKKKEGNELGNNEGGSGKDVESIIFCVMLFLWGAQGDSVGSWELRQLNFESRLK